METCQRGQKGTVYARPIDYVDSLRGDRRDDSIDAIAMAISSLSAEARVIAMNPPVVVHPKVDEAKETDKAIDDLVDAFVGKPDDKQ